MNGNRFLESFNWQSYRDDGRTCLLRSGQSAVEYNLILSGRSQEMDKAIELVGIKGILQKQVDTIAFDELAGRGLMERVPALKAFEDVEIRLYQLDGETTEQSVWDSVRKIYRAAAEKGWIIFADPNLITIAPGGPGGGGSGGAVGGPLDKLGKKGTEKEFIEHWAFGPQGIGLEDGRSSRLVPDVTGKDVQVFVFDTCDRRIEAEIALDPELKDISTILTKPEIRRGYPPEPLTLTILSPAGRYHPDRGLRRPVRILSSNDPAMDVDEHGLFVAGLIHRVAPESSIYLVDVLNKEGRGESFGLLKALYMLAQGAGTGVMNDRPLEGVVINLSLGTTLSETSIEAMEIHRLLSELRESVYSNPQGNHLLHSLLDDMVNHNYYVGSLRLVIRLLYELGAVIVAAAGNDSGKVVGERLKQIPAAYPEVIAVAASTFDRRKANFSNLGDIMAPGGGRPLPDVDTKFYKYDDEPDEDYKKYSIISVVPKFAKDDSGFAYWRGTSFSTPFVSGLIALMIQKLRTGKGSLHPNHFRELLLQYAREDVINVLTILGQI